MGSFEQALFATKNGVILSSLTRGFELGPETNDGLAIAPLFADFRFVILISSSFLLVFIRTGATRSEAESKDLLLLFRTKRIEKP